MTPRLLLLSLAFLFAAAAAEADVTYGFGSSSYTVAEGATVSVTVVRSEEPLPERSVYLQVSVPGWGENREVAFSAGQASATVSLTSRNDGSWSGPLTGHLYCGGAVVPLTVLDDEAFPTLTIDDVVVSEANYETLVWLKSTPPISSYATINLTCTLEGASFPGADATVDTSSLPTRLSIVPVRDTVAEEDEHLRLVLDGSGFHAEVAVELLDDDAVQPRFGAATWAFAEPAANGAGVVERPSLTEFPLDMVLSIEPLDGAYFPTTSFPFSFAAGESSRSVSIPVNDSFSGTRRAKLRLRKGVRDLGTSSLEVADDEPMPTLAIDDFEVSEGQSGRIKEVGHTLTLSNALARTLRVFVEFTGVTATSGADFYPGKLVIDIPATRASMPVLFDVIGDADPEPDETLQVKVTSCCSGLATLARGTGTCTIIDDDGPGAAVAHFLDQVPVTVAESALRMPVRITRAGGTGNPSSVTLRAVASSPSVQPAIPPVAVSFAPGETAKNAELAVDDAVYSGDRTVRVELVFNGMVDDSTTAGITENEPLPAIALLDATGKERPGGSEPARFVMTVTPPYAADLPVDLRTSDSTAQAGRDYTAVSRSSKVRAGEAAAEFEVPVLDDFAVEGDEHFVLSATARRPYGGASTVLKATGTIRDDDGALRTLLPDGSWVEKGYGVDLTLDYGEPSPAAQTVTLVSSAPEVVFVPASVPLTWKSRTVGFTAAGLKRGSAVVTATFITGQQVTTRVHVFEKHLPVAVPSAVDARIGGAAQLWVMLSPASASDVHLELRSLDPAVAATGAGVLVPAGGTGVVEVVGVAAGSTAIELKLPRDHGETVTTVPVLVTPRARRRSVRH